MSQRPLSFRFLGSLLASMVFAATPGRAAESIVTDPQTSTQIIWFSQANTAVAGSWSGKAVDGKAQGPGMLKLKVRTEDGKELQLQAKGVMFDGRLHGEASLKWSNGISFEVPFRNGRKQGKGIARWPDGALFVGEWKNDFLEGDGAYYAADGSWYQGEWSASKKHGKGMMRFPNGAVYIGDWKNDLMEGQGTFFYADGSRYEGEWKANQKNGKGRFKRPNGQISYEGDYRNDVMFGTGKITYPNGATYEGKVDGGAKGSGILKDATGKIVYQGEWKGNGEDKGVSF